MPEGLTTASVSRSAYCPLVLQLYGIYTPRISAGSISVQRLLYEWWLRSVEELVADEGETELNERKDDRGGLPGGPTVQ